MSAENLLLKYIWLIMLLGVGLSTIRLWFEARSLIAKNPELQAGYNQLYKGFVITMSLPWLVMGIGIILGGVPSFVEFFQPESGNPFVLAFWFVLVSLLLLGFWWVYFREGAEFLAKHPGALGARITSPTVVKILIGMIFIGGIIVLTTFWIQ